MPENTGHLAAAEDALRRAECLEQAADRRMIDAIMVAAEANSLRIEAEAYRQLGRAHQKLATAADGLPGVSVPRPEVVP